jgi:MFS family permease
MDPSSHGVDRAVHNLGICQLIRCVSSVLRDALDTPPSTISWIGSIQTFLTFFVGVFSGRMLDAGLFLPTFLAGVIIQLLGIFTMSLSTKFWQLFLTQGILTGIGGGIFFCPAMGLVVTYFEKNRALAVALATTGNSTGGIIYPLLARELLSRIGFAWTARVLGFLNLSGLGLAAAFMRPRLPPRKSGPIIDWSAFRDLKYMLFVIGMFFIMWASYFVFFFVCLSPFPR